MTTIGCEISHKDTKQTDKCSNNKTKPAQKGNETTDKYFQNIVKTAQKKFDKVHHIIQGPYNKQ
jgi:stalled ribosome rescue protein Dom34